jgi:hypothetical protein
MVVCAIIPALKRLRQEDDKFKNSLGYVEFEVSQSNIVSPSQKNTS